MVQSQHLKNKKTGLKKLLHLVGAPQGGRTDWKTQTKGGKRTHNKVNKEYMKQSSTGLIVLKLKEREKQLKRFGAQSL